MCSMLAMACKTDLVASALSPPCAELKHRKVVRFVAADRSGCEPLAVGAKSGGEIRTLMNPGTRFTAAHDAGPRPR